MCMCAFALNASAQTTAVTQQQAFEQVSKLFEGRDVDYYELTPVNTSDQKDWIFFVDAMPIALWSHECYVVTYPKEYPSRAKCTPKSEQLNFPPEGYNYKAYKVIDRSDFVIDDECSEELIIDPNDKTTPSLSGNSGQSSSRTYALIVGGEPTPEEKPYADKFFEDCALFYNTLTKNYKVPKENVDVLIYNPGSKTDSYDMDGDYESDIKGYATTSTIKDCIKGFSERMQPNDHLIIYIASHGAYNTDATKGTGLYIGSWDYMYASDLLQYLTPVINKKINTTVIVDACYSAGFVRLLNVDNCVAIASAESMSLRIDPLSYFSKYINEAFKSKSADTNRDGIITIDEAFQYTNDKVVNTKFRDPRYKNYTQQPYMQSIPAGLSKELAIDKVPMLLSIGSNPETSASYNVFWNSPDVWLRMIDDKKTEHQNVNFKSSDSKAIVNVKISNSGDMPYVSGKTLRLYWAQASAVTTPSMWNGNWTKDEEPIGGHLADIKLTDISPNSSKTITHIWSIPSEIINSERHPEHHQFSIFAKIVDDVDVPDEQNFEIGSSLQSAQSTLSVIKKTDTRISSVYFYNATDSAATYNLKLMCRNEGAKSIFGYANVIIEMSPTVYYSWLRGGKKALAVVDNGYSPYSSQLLEHGSVIQDISMVPWGFGRVSVIFDFFEAPGGKSINGVFDLVQTTSNGDIIGGQTITLESPYKPLVAFPADSLIWGGGIGTINPDPDFGIIKTASWYDSKNRKVSKDWTLTVSPKNRGESFKYVTISNDGELTTSSITVTSEFGIKNAQYDKSARVLNVEMHETPVQGYVITLASITSGKVLFTKELLEEDKHIRIDTSCLQSGLYVLTCVLNDEIVSTEKISIF